MQEPSIPKKKPKYRGKNPSVPTKNLEKTVVVFGLSKTLVTENSLLSEPKVGAEYTISELLKVKYKIAIATHNKSSDINDWLQKKFNLTKDQADSIHIEYAPKDGSGNKNDLLKNILKKNPGKTEMIFFSHDSEHIEALDKIREEYLNCTITGFLVAEFRSKADYFDEGLKYLGVEPAAIDYYSDPDEEYRGFESDSDGEYNSYPQFDSDNDEDYCSHPDSKTESSKNSLSQPIKSSENFEVIDDKKRSDTSTQSKYPDNFEDIREQLVGFDRYTRSDSHTKKSPEIIKAKEALRELFGILPKDKGSESVLCTLVNLLRKLSKHDVLTEPELRSVKKNENILFELGENPKKNIQKILAEKIESIASKEDPLNSIMRAIAFKDNSITQSVIKHLITCSPQNMQLKIFQYALDKLTPTGTPSQRRRGQLVRRDRTQRTHGRRVKDINKFFLDLIGEPIPKKVEEMPVAETKSRVKKQKKPSSTSTSSLVAEKEIKLIKKPKRKQSASSSFPTASSLVVKKTMDPRKKQKQPIPSATSSSFFKSKNTTPISGKLVFVTRDTPRSSTTSMPDEPIYAPTGTPRSPTTSMSDEWISALPNTPMPPATPMSNESVPELLENWANSKLL